jgi:hypothetical protein
MTVTNDWPDHEKESRVKSSNFATGWIKFGRVLLASIVTPLIGLHTFTTFVHYEKVL